MDIVFYDKEGNAVCYTEDNKEIYFFDGRPAGVIDGGYLFNFSGENIGWLEDGIVRDIEGYVVLYTATASEDMPLPAPRSIPGKSGKQVPPQNIVTTMRHACAVKRYDWYGGEAKNFF